MSAPVKVSTATVLPATSEVATSSSTRLPSGRRSSKAPGSRVTAVMNVTVRLVTGERWAEPSLTTTLATLSGPWITLIMAVVLVVLGLVSGLVTVAVTVWSPTATLVTMKEKGWLCWPGTSCYSLQLR